jgi:hypothetical protein
MLQVGRHGHEVLECFYGLLALLRVPGAQRRGEDLLQERRLAVGRGPEHPQVSAPDAVAGQLGHGADDLALGLVVALHARAQLALDHPVLLQLAHELGVRVGVLEHVLEGVDGSALGHRHRRRPHRPPLRAGRGRGSAASGRQLLADDAEWEELVALEAQDGAQSRHVPRRVEAVAPGRAPRREQLLVLEVTDLGDRDVRELRLERLADGADRHRLRAAAWRLGGRDVGQLDRGVLGAGGHHGLTCAGRRACICRSEVRRRPRAAASPRAGG